jgi:4-carboxymuconolactone decarboxylase
VDKEYEKLPGSNAPQITSSAEEYHARMFPGYKSDFKRTDPEFIERFDNFAFDEVIKQTSDKLDDHTPSSAIWLHCSAVRVLMNSVLCYLLRLIWA